MKGLLILIALFILGGAILLELVRSDPGYVLIAFQNTTIEMGFWFATAAFILTLAIIWLSVSLCKKVWRTLSGSLLWASHNRHRKVERKTSSGLVHFIEGNWRDAKRDLLSAAKKADDPLVHYLAAARSAFELGDRDETQKLLHQAEKTGTDNELVIALSQARIQLLDKQYEQCLATLARVKKLVPKHPVILDLLKQVYWSLGDWTSLQALLPDLRALKLYREDEWQLLEQNVYIAMLSQAGKKALNSEQPDSINLDSLWHKVPRHQRQNTRLIAVYVKQLIQLTLDDQAEPILRNHLHQHWESELVYLYGLLKTQQPQEQLIIAEAWLRERPGDASLLLALGRISLRNELWGKAREYFEGSLKLKPQPETFAELARLLAYLGEHKQSTDYYQQGLLMSTHGLPSLPMPHNKPSTQIS